MIARATRPTTRFTVDEYFRLDEAGVFDGQRVQLLNGRIYRMPAQKVPHLWSITKSTRALVALVPAHEWLLVQGTFVLDDISAPDPDFTWLPCAPGTPVERWPLPVLVVEVSWSTYRFDTGPKLRKYAQRGVPDYWVENLKADRVEVYRDPRNPTGDVRGCGYASVTHFGRGERIDVLARPGVSVAVDDLLP